MVRRKLNRTEIALWVLVSVMTILTLTFYLWHITENVQLGYDIGRGEVRKQELRDELKRLEAQRAALRSLERVEGIARKDLGMTETREDQIIYKDR